MIDVPIKVICEVCDTELEASYCVDADGDCTIAVEECCECRDTDVTSAEEKGYEKGYEAGHEVGYDKGLEAGYEEGHEIGYDAAKEECDV